MLFSHSSEQSEEEQEKTYKKSANYSKSQNEENEAERKFMENDEEESVSLNNLHKSTCTYCLNSNPKTLSQCYECKQYFCNSVMPEFGSHLIIHLVRAKHKTIKLHKESALGDIILECFFCGRRNIFALGFAPYRANKTNELIICCRKFNCSSSETISTHELNPQEWEPLIKEKRIVDFILSSQPVEEMSLFSSPPIKAIYEFETAAQSGKKVSMREVLSAKVKSVKLPHVQLQWSNIHHYCRTFTELIEVEIAEDQKIYEKLVFEKTEISWESFESKLKKGSFVLPVNEEINISSLKGQELMLIDCKTKDEVAVLTVLNIMGVDRVVAVVKTEHQKLSNACPYDVKMLFKPMSFMRMIDGLNSLLTKAQKVIDQRIFQILLGNVYAIKNTIKEGVYFNPSVLTNIPGIPQLNQSQIQAVGKAVTNNFTLLQGPPGTGKSVTCSAIVYYFTKVAKKGQTGAKDKILVCAPSNIAVDHLTDYISKTGVKVTQICSRMRESVEAPEGEYFLHRKLEKELEKPENLSVRKLRDKKKTEFISEEENKELNSKEYKIAINLIKDADVICCTCISSFDPRLLPFSFSIVLVDEATQAIEPEGLLPFLKKAETVVLIGDHMQLGPVVMSPESAQAGLKQSLFERMIKLGVTPVRLQTQYRMHPELSLFSSETFYEGGLQNGVNTVQRTDTTLDFPWPNSSKPLFFWHVVGKEELSGSGTSYLNKMEADVIETIVETFYKAGLEKNKLCIITPYKGQRAFLKNQISRLLPSENGFNESIEINSIDSFQGREKDYVILSTVRSSDSSGIGFLKDERRLNVALTRAKYGLIVIGNSHSLAKSPFWRGLLHHFSNSKLIFEGSNLSNLRPSLISFTKPETMFAFDKAKIMRELNLETGNGSKLKEFLADDFRKSELGFSKLPQN